MLTAVLFVLKTGIGWKDLPTEAFGVSYKTCTRRIDEWTNRGIWQQIHELFLAKLRGADLLNWSRVLVDCSLVKAPLGGENAGRTRRIAAARAVSTACSPTPRACTRRRPRSTASTATTRPRSRPCARRRESEDEHRMDEDR